MRENRVRGGGSSAAPGRLSPGLAALCLWLGLATSQVVAETPLHKGKVTASHSADEGIKNFQLTVSFTGAPENLRPEGELKLILQDGNPSKTLAGSYTAGGGKLTAKFNVERGLTNVSYTAVSILPSGPELQLAEPVDVFAVKPKEMKVALDPASTTDEILTFNAHVAEIPPRAAASDCNKKLYFVQRESSGYIDLEARTKPQLIRQANGLVVTFQFDRPLSAQPIYDAVLELCDEADQWVYRGGPVDLIPLQELEIRPQKRAGAAQTLWLEVPASKYDPARHLNARILDGADSISELQKEKQISFELRGGSYHAEVTVACSAQVTELPELRIVAKDDKNREYLLRSRGGERVCAQSAPPPWIEVTSLLWLAGTTVLIGLAIWAIVYCHKIWPWFQRGEKPKTASPQDLSPSSHPPSNKSEAFLNSFPVAWKSGLEEILNLQLDSLRRTLHEVRSVLSQVRNHQLQSPVTGDPALGYDRIDVEEQRGPSASPYRRLQAQLGDPLTDLVSRWWAEGADRDRLDDLVLQNPAIKPYRSSNVQDSMRNTTNRTFLFQPVEGLAEWLGRAQQGELLLVPGDPKLFQTGDSLKFLGVLFEGLGSSLSDVRFRRVLKPCRLRREPGSSDRYRVVERGLLELQGGPAAETFANSGLSYTRAPQVAPAIQKSELAEAVRNAIEKAMPGGLTNQIQDLSQQVRTLAQSGARQGNGAPRTDPGVTTALAAVREDLALLGQRMSTVEGMARMVDSLRESLARIEGGLREINPQQPPLPAPPAVPAPAPALPEIDIMDLPSEPWLEIREDIGDNRDPVLPSHRQLIVVPDQPDPEQLWGRLQKWWPVLNGRIPDGYYAGDSSAAYLWSLEEVRRTLAKAGARRGWQIGMVHVKVPDSSPAGEQILQIHEPISVGERSIVCTCVPKTPFNGPLLFQFALRVVGDQEQTIAVLPAPGLRLTGSTEGYTRLAGGKLPENATSLTEVLRPAILNQANSSDLYTVVLPMRAKFQ